LLFLNGNMNKSKPLTKTEGFRERKGTGSAVPHKLAKLIGFSRCGTVFRMIATGSWGRGSRALAPICLFDRWNLHPQGAEV
jgi:hypothetical protein